MVLHGLDSQKTSGSEDDGTFSAQRKSAPSPCQNWNKRFIFILSLMYNTIFSLKLENEWSVTSASRQKIRSPLIFEKLVEPAYF